jgi:transcriptional regulator with XRE-family HTH domain
MPVDDIEALVRQRLRGLRLSLGLSLDDLAARTHLSASTISRVETGKRTISLDVLRALCTGLQTDMATLLETSTDDDVVIRPVASRADGQTIWPLSRPRGEGGVNAVKMRLEPRRHEGELGVHPGHDWFFVLSGTVLLTLGDREIEVHEGEAAEFSTMTPHGFGAVGGPAEVVMIFDRDGRHAHLHGLHPEDDADP